jgi:predicted dinucleotide-binding enzyme
MSKETLMLTIAVLGGTGREGKGLAYRWAKAGYQVLIGSRYSEKAVTVASEIMELLE